MIQYNNCEVINTGDYWPAKITILGVTYSALIRKQSFSIPPAGVYPAAIAASPFIYPESYTCSIQIGSN
jgi:hypothetical protein